MENLENVDDAEFYPRCETCHLGKRVLMKHRTRTFKPK